MFNVVFGSGPLGAATARALLDLGHEVLLVSRSGKVPDAYVDDLKPELARRFKVRPVDAADPQQVLAATAGATHIFDAMGLPYQDWYTGLPPIRNNLIAAAIARGSVLAVGSNLYMYAKGTKVIAETTPEEPPTRKGRVQLQQHQRLVNAEKDGLRWTTVRASDFYGPGAHFQSMFGTTRFLDPLLAGKSPTLVGDPGLLHSYTYLEDYGRALATAAYETKAHGKAWIVPNAPATTTRELAEVFFLLAGRKSRLVVLPDLAVSLVGIFNPFIREFSEMLYQKHEPYVADGSLFEKTFSFSPTPIEQAVRNTLEWAHARSKHS